MKRLAGLALLGAALFALTARAQEVTDAGTVGQWRVGCSWEAETKTPHCLISAIVKWDGDVVAVAYFPFQHRFEALAPKLDIHAAGVFKDERPLIQAFEAKCAGPRCVFDNAEFLAALKLHKYLLVSLSSPGKKAMTVSEDLGDLQRATAIANSWATQEAKKH